jgi:hypothetical protein
LAIGAVRNNFQKCGQNRTYPNIAPVIADLINNFRCPSVQCFRLIRRLCNAMENNKFHHKFKKRNDMNIERCEKLTKNKFSVIDGKVGTLLVRHFLYELETNLGFSNPSHSPEVT